MCVWPRPFRRGRGEVAIGPGPLARSAVVASTPTCQRVNKATSSVVPVDRTAVAKPCGWVRGALFFGIGNRKPSKWSAGLIGIAGTRVMLKHSHFLQRVWFDLPLARPTSRHSKMRHAIFGVMLVIVFVWAWLASLIHP